MFPVLTTIGIVLPAPRAVPARSHHPHPDREVSGHLSGQVHEVGELLTETAGYPCGSLNSPVTPTSLSGY